MARPKKVTEELAQLRNTRQMIFFLAQTIEQRDQQIADALDRVDRKLDQVVCLMEQYAASSERGALEAVGFVVQASELLRRMRGDLYDLPAAVVAAMTRQLVEPVEPHLVEVGAGSAPRPHRSQAG